jgi:hypothetical protein
VSVSTVINVIDKCCAMDVEQCRAEKTFQQGLPRFHASGVSGLNLGHSGLMLRHALYFFCADEAIAITYLSSPYWIRFVFLFNRSDSGRFSVPSGTVAMRAWQSAVLDRLDAAVASVLEVC